MPIIITPEAKQLLDRTARSKFPELTIIDNTTPLPDGNFLWDIHPLVAAKLAMFAHPKETPSDAIIRLLTLATHGLQ